MLSAPLALPPSQSTMPPPCAHATEAGVKLSPMLQRAFPVAASSPSATEAPPPPMDTVFPDASSHTTPPIGRRRTSSGDRDPDAPGAPAPQALAIIPTASAPPIRTTAARRVTAAPASTEASSASAVQRTVPCSHKAEHDRTATHNGRPRHGPSAIDRFVTAATGRVQPHD